jgi:hypothetical protein
VTDKNHTRVTFAFDNLEEQLQRLEQFLVYSDDTKRELATVNLLVQRNIPVTFAKPAAEVINDTIQPEATPRILKAIPIRAAQPGGSVPARSRSTSTPSVRRATSVQQEKKN